jgi:hypothetical protein
MPALRAVVAALLVACPSCGARTSLELPAADSAAPPATTTSPPALQLLCPTSLDDPRLPVVSSEGLTELDAAAFIQGDVRSYKWSIDEEDCDRVVPRAGYILEGSTNQIVRFHPARPGSYRLRLAVVGSAGDEGRCEFSLNVRGRGLRVELCWDTSTTTDLDLYLHTPFNQAPWFAPSSDGVIDGMTGDTCNTANCTPDLRFGQPRANWGYPDSPLAICSAGPSAKEFQALGRCPNPRAGDDNNQQIASGTTERVQLDNPGHDQRFSIMVQNFSNSPAQPHVFVYCGSTLAGRLEPPPAPPNFVTPTPGRFGVMWRASNVTTHVNAAGETSDCELEPARLGVTIDDPSF